MAKKTIRVSDKSGMSIPDNSGATVRIVYADARRGVKELDVTNEEADQMAEGGRQVQRRGRPKAATA